MNFLRLLSGAALLLFLATVSLRAQNVCEECWTVYDTTNAPFHYDMPWAMAMDSAGNIWAGEGNGWLHKFDGKRWTSFDLKLFGAPAASIQGMAIDRKGIFWMAINGKLARWDGHERVDTFDIENTYGLEVAVRPDGVILFGTHYQGIYLYKPKDGTIEHFWGEWEQSGSGHGMWMWNINNFQYDPHGDLWFASRRGVWRYDGKSFHQFDTSNSAIRDPVIYNIIFDSSGAMWTAGMPLKNLCRYRDGVWEEFPSIGSWMEFSLRPDRPAAYCASRVILLHDGSILVGDQFIGAVSIYRDGVWYQPGVPERVKRLRGLSPTLVDRRGRVWMRTRGLVVYDPARDQPRPDTTVPPPVRWRPKPSPNDPAVPGLPAGSPGRQ